MRRIIQLNRLSTLIAALPAAWLCACGGGGDGGRPSESANPDGHAIICTGTFVNGQTGVQVPFPCKLGADGACVAVPAADVPQLACVLGPEGTHGEPTLPAIGKTSANLEEGFCACKDATLPVEQQAGSCQQVCDEIVLKSANFNNNDPKGPWSCKNAIAAPNGEKSLTKCEHGSVVYLNGGPSDYAMQLVGKQTSSGSFDYGLGTYTSSGDGNVDGFMRFSVTDRSGGCAAGCRMSVDELGLIFKAFSVPGFELDLGITSFGWGGLSMQDSSLINQGMLEGLVYDDGHFSLHAGEGKLVVVYRGDRNGAFSKVLDRPLTGHIDFVNANVSLDDITLSQDGGTIRVHDVFGNAVKSPPIPHITNQSSYECQTPQGTNVTLSSAGTTDREGGPLSHEWFVDGGRVGMGASLAQTLSYGAHTVRLASSDSTLGKASTRLPISIVDTTAPVWSQTPTADFTSCDAQVDRQALAVPAVLDACTGVQSVQAWLIEVGGVPLAQPSALDIGSALLPKGQSTVLWVARDAAGNESTLRQTMRVGPAIQSLKHLEIRDRAKVVSAAGALGGVGNLGNEQSSFGVSSRVAEVLSVGSLFFQNYAVVSGLAASRGNIDLQAGANIGQLQAHSAVDLGTIPWLAEVSGATFTNADVSVGPDSLRSLGSGSYGKVQVYSRGRLVLTGPNVQIRELWLEPDAVLELGSTSTTLTIRDRVVDRGKIVATQGGARARLFVLGEQVLFEQPVSGLSVIAPNARVTLTSQASAFHLGTLVGGIVEVQPDVTLYCDRGATLPPR